jgi:hypothetical protein
LTIFCRYESMMEVRRESMASRRRPSQATSAQDVSQDFQILAGLTDFAALLDDFAAAVIDELELAGQSERQAVAQAFRATLAVQANSVRDLFRDILTNISAEGAAEAELFWRSSGASVAISGARAAIQNGALAKRSVLEWIKLIIELIKKVILQLLDHLQDLPFLAGIKKWLLIILAIANIIDNLLAALNDLLAGREPVDMHRVSRNMWQGLETYWRAKAAFLRVARVDLDARGESNGGIGPTG